MPTSRDMAIFVLTTTTQPITLPPCACARGKYYGIQWNPSKADTIGTKNFVCCSEVSLAQGVVVDLAPPTIAASYDKALLWMTKKTVLMRDLSIDSS